MGARGPAPTPTPILEARGSRWPERRGGDDLRPPVERPSCPAWLKGEARAEWSRQVAQLHRLGVLARIDRMMLAMYCSACGEFVVLTQRLAELVEGDIDAGYARATAAGLLNARNKVTETAIKLAAQFGFSPAARARLRTEPPRKEEAEGKAKYFHAG